MLFSELYNISKDQDDDWFDPILSIDTPLFIDPFLIYTQEENEFVGSHNQILEFFTVQFSETAKSKGNENSTRFLSVCRALSFPEVKELCLGFSKYGTSGSGTGAENAKIMARAIWEAISAGVDNIEHFEEIALLHEGIGADRISDIVGNLLKIRLIQYTQRICAKHNILCSHLSFRNTYYDLKLHSWISKTVDLPVNPYNQRAVLLVPEKYLRTLPTINAEDFWDFCYVNENEILRSEFGEDITRNVDKQKIITFAKSHPEIREQYIRDVESSAGDPYDFSKDQQGLYNWYFSSAEYVSQNQLILNTSTKALFFQSIDIMLNGFKHFVEENKGWSLLWNDDNRQKRESAAQLLCLGIIKGFCKANNIDLSREVDVGRGYVDFKVSRGYQLRALIEVKKANNTRFWNGLEIQLPTYMYAEGIKKGIFLVVAYTDKDMEKIEGINLITESVIRKVKYSISVIVIDARIKPSASLL